MKIVQPTLPNFVGNTGFAGVRTSETPNGLPDNSGINIKTIPLAQREELEGKYANELAEALNKKKGELYEYLDLATDEAGLTIKDKLAQMFDMNSQKIQEGTFLHKTLAENVAGIQKNGVDLTKIRNTKYGPGFYVGADEGTLEIYSGKKLKIKYKGNTAEGTRLEEYAKIRSKAVDMLTKHLKLDLSRDCFAWKTLETFGTFINEYSRKTISEKLGIDGASAIGSERYFVIFNPDAVIEVAPYDIN